MSSGVTPETLKLMATQAGIERFQKSKQRFDAVMEILYKKLTDAAKVGLFRYTLERGRLRNVVSDDYYDLDESLFSLVVAELVKNRFTVNMLDKCKCVIIWE